MRASLPIGLVLLALSAPLLARAASGGPDAGGWSWADTASGGSPFAYEYGNNAEVFYPLTPDSLVPVPLPFTFDLYSYTLSTLGVHTNGVITPTTFIPVEGTNSCPLTPGWSALIAPYWDALPIELDGLIVTSSLGVAPQRVFIIEWSLERPTPGEFLAFEVKLFEEDGHIEFHYLYVESSDTSVSSGASATVGLASTSSSLMVGCDSPVLSDEYAITLYPPGLCADPDGDGVCPPNDCDDSDGSVYPGAVEIPGDGIDQDCDGADEPIGDDDDATGDDDDATGDDDDSVGDDDDATGDDDDSVGDDDDSAGDDDDATGDDDDSVGDDDDSAIGDDDDATGGGGGRSTTARRTGCAMAPTSANGPFALLLLGFALILRRRAR